MSSPPAWPLAPPPTSPRPTPIPGLLGSPNPTSPGLSSPLSKSKTSSPPTPPGLASSPPYKTITTSPSTPSLRIGAPLSMDAVPRNIVVLLDGTGQQFSARNSNVIKMLSVLEADETQLLYYSSGVGTVLPDHASTWGKIRAGVAEATDKALAWNHTDFLCNAYKYLMDYYRAGDKLYIFGFSRGAYTARALAGMIQKVGLLPPGNHNQVKLAYEVYLRPALVKLRSGMPMDSQEDPAVMYRQIFGISRAVRIEFLGVWDTVSSLGGIYLPRLPHAGNVKTVKFFRQALALDERRARFAPEYRYLEENEMPCEATDAKEALIEARQAYATLHAQNASPQAKFEAREKLKEMLDGKYPVVAMTDPIPSASAGEGAVKSKIWKKNKEVWFMGTHSDCGGGNDLNMTESLSNIPFRWMLREAVRCGVKLEPAGVALQPALYTSEEVHRQGLIPTELISILKEELRGETIEYDNERRVRQIIEQCLPYSRLVEIVELAAAFDSGMTGGDNAVGEPIGVDGVRDYTESLTPWWWPLEVTLLQTRMYGGGLGQERDVWRINLARGRQIVPGHAIHRSVLKRLRYDNPLPPSIPTAADLRANAATASSPSPTIPFSALPVSQDTAPRPRDVRDVDDKKARIVSDASRLSAFLPGPLQPGAGSSEPAEQRSKPPRAWRGKKGAKTKGSKGDGGDADSVEIKVGDATRDLRGVRAGRKKRVYDAPRASLPLDWGTDWEQLRMGGGPMIWED